VIQQALQFGSLPCGAGDLVGKQLFGPGRTQDIKLAVKVLLSVVK